MPIDEQELRALCFLTLRVRKSTPGAGAWDEHGVMENLRKVQNRNLHMTIEHVLRHAADPKAKSPGVIQGRFTPPTPAEDPSWLPPKRGEQCLDCGAHIDHCLCGSQRTTPVERGNATSGANAVRRAAGITQKHPPGTDIVSTALNEAIDQLEAQ